MGKFMETLSTAPTRPSGLFALADDIDGGQRLSTMGRNEAPNGGSLGAEARRISGIFYITAAYDSTGDGQQSGTDRIAGVRRPRSL